MRKKRKTSRGVRAKKSWKRTVGKIFFWTLCGVVFLILLVLLVVILYPSAKAGALASRQISGALGMPVEIRNLTVNPFGRLKMEGLTVRHAEGADPDTLFSLDRLVVRYRFIPLIRRRLDVIAVRIDGPRLHGPKVPPVQSIETDISGTETLSDSISSAIQTAVVPSTKPLLPLSLGLFRLALNDFDFLITIPDPSGDKVIGLEDVYLEVSDLRFPRDPGGAPQNLKGDVRLTCPGGLFRWEEEAFEIRWITELNVEAAWKSAQKWDVLLQLEINSESPGGEPVRFESEIEGEGFAEQARLQRLELHAGGFNILAAEGNWEWTGHTPRVELSVTSDDGDIRELTRTFSGLLPAPLMDWMETFDLTGRIQPLQGRIVGFLDTLHVSGEAVVSNASVRIPEADLLAEGFSSTVHVSGVWSDALLDGSITGRAELETCRIALNDTVSIPFNHVQFEFESRLDTAFYPAGGSLSARIGSVLGGSLETAWDWTLRDGLEAATDRIVADGILRSDTLRLDEMPFLPAELSGSCILALDGSVDGLGSIRTDWRIDSPGISWSDGETSDSTPPLHVVSRVAFGLKDENSIVLDSASIRLNEHIRARLHGHYGLESNRFRVHLDGHIDNQIVPDMLPLALQETMADIIVSGREEVALTLNGGVLEDTILVSLDGTVTLIDFGVEYPPALIRVQNVNGFASAHGDPAHLNGKVELDIERSIVERLRPEPVEGIHFSTDWTMRGSDSLWTDGRIHVDDLGLQGLLILGLGDLKGLPTLSADADFTFRSDRFVEVVQGMSLSGDARCRIHGHLLDAEKQWIRLSGSVDIDSLDLIQENLLHVSGMEGSLPFQIDIDGLNGELLFRPENRPPRWDEYETRRTAYKSMTPFLGTIRAASVDVSGYLAEDILLDVYASQGFIQIPWFHMNLLEGNMGGSLLVELGTGKPNQITYEIKAQLSRINAASLLEGQADDKGQTELNATLAFTGRGIDITQRIDLDGAFHITKIGPEFASTLLNVMDPSGSDRSIRLTRKLLNTGWKPKLFSFELRHGYVYPSIALSQPWFSPIRIPGQLEYGRLPLAFFLKPQTQ